MINSVKVAELMHKLEIGPPMVSKVEQAARNSIRNATRTALTNAINNHNEALDTLQTVRMMAGLPPYLSDTLVVRTNRKGDIIIADSVTKNKVELAEVARLIEYYNDQINDLHEEMRDREKINQIEAKIIAAIGNDDWAWYQSKTMPQWDDPES